MEQRLFVGYGLQMVTVQEALKQIAEGRDFDSLTDLLKDLTAAQAVNVPTGSPYSIATLTYHTWFWQDRWLKQIDGEHTPPWTAEDDDSDFPVILPEDWESIRLKLLTDFTQVQGLANQPESFDRVTQFGDTVEVLLLRNALHCAYHLGQIMLLRRLMSLDSPH